MVRRKVLRPPSPNISSHCLVPKMSHIIWPLSEPYLSHFSDNSGQFLTSKCRHSEAKRRCRSSELPAASLVNLAPTSFVGLTMCFCCTQMLFVKILCSRMLRFNTLLLKTFYFMPWTQSEEHFNAVGDRGGDGVGDLRWRRCKRCRRCKGCRWNKWNRGWRRCWRIFQRTRKVRGAGCTLRPTKVWRGANCKVGLKHHFANMSLLTNRTIALLQTMLSYAEVL